MLAGADSAVSMSAPPGRTGIAVTASIFLVVMAVLFIEFPVLQPWSGPPEPFVRWHPFSEHAEVVWRGIFLSFAAAMLLAALDPLGRHRFFLILLVTSGSLHAAEMAVDNLCAARMGGVNGNAEHLYGDVLGWFAIAAASLILLVADRRPRAHEDAPRTATGGHALRGALRRRGVVHQPGRASRTHGVGDGPRGEAVGAELPAGDLDAGAAGGVGLRRGRRGVARRGRGRAARRRCAPRGVVPFTFLVIMPTNHALLAPGRDLGCAETRALLETWGRLHAVRTGLGLTATMLCLWLLGG